MKGKKYYAVVADNGFLCSSSWEQVERMKIYFRGFFCIGYKSKEDAMMATRQGYNDRHMSHMFIGEIDVNIPRFTKDFLSSEMLVLDMSYKKSGHVTTTQLKQPIPMVEFY